MKRSLSLIGGMVFLLAFGMAYAANGNDTMLGKNEKGYRMITDEDLLKYDHGSDLGTVSQMEARPIESGSAAGGSGDTVVKDDTSEKTPPPSEEKVAETNDDTGRGTYSPSTYQGGYQGMSGRSGNTSPYNGSAMTPRTQRRY